MNTKKTATWKVAIQINPQLVQEHSFNFFPLSSLSLSLQEQRIGHSINEIHQQHLLLTIKPFTFRDLLAHLIFFINYDMSSSILILLNSLGAFLKTAFGLNEMHRLPSKGIQVKAA